MDYAVDFTTDNLKSKRGIALVGKIFEKIGFGKPERQDGTDVQLASGGSFSASLQQGAMRGTYTSSEGSSEELIITADYILRNTASGWEYWEDPRRQE